MDQQPPPLRDQRWVDLNHLKLLWIFHFISAGLGFVGLLFMLGQYAMMRFFFSNPEIWEMPKGNAPPVEFFALFEWFYLVFAAWSVFSVVLNLISGFALRAKRWRVFSLFVSGVNCLRMPFGTILGVFTIIVLVRESVRDLYAANAGGA